jgi:hypothetical protein
MALQAYRAFVKVGGQRASTLRTISHPLGPRQNQLETIKAGRSVAPSWCDYCPLTRCIGQDAIRQFRGRVEQIQGIEHMDDGEVVYEILEQTIDVIRRERMVQLPDSRNHQLWKKNHRVDSPEVFCLASHFSSIIQSPKVNLKKRRRVREELAKWLRAVL